MKRKTFMDLCLFNASCRIPEVINNGEHYEQQSETANEVLPQKSGGISTRWWLRQKEACKNDVKDIRGFDCAGGGM